MQYISMLLPPCLGDGVPRVLDAVVTTWVLRLGVRCGTLVRRTSNLEKMPKMAFGSAAGTEQRCIREAGPVPGGKDAGR